MGYEYYTNLPNSNTFSIKPISNLIGKYLSDDMLSIDPFANISRIAKITNDLNPDYKTDFHLDAIDFFETESVDFVLYDPPYSLRQVSECYKGVGSNYGDNTSKLEYCT